MSEKKIGKAKVYEAPNKQGFCVVAQDVEELLIAIGAVNKSSGNSFDPLSTETRYTGAKLTKTDDGFDVQFKSEILCVLSAKAGSKFETAGPTDASVTVSDMLHGISDIVTRSMMLDIMGEDDESEKPDKGKH